MHEWALADSVLKCADVSARENGLKQVDEVVIVLGELQNADAQCLADVYNELKGQYGEPLSSSRPVFETEKAVFLCRACGLETEFGDRDKMAHGETEAVHFIPETAGIYIKCPACSSPDLKIVAGRGVYIQEIRGGK
ncbi:MAG: hydrogenase/urease maturation nickel metallochaperone HypA [Elusimicrobiaceae bacterium]